MIKTWLQFSRIVRGLLPGFLLMLTSCSYHNETVIQPMHPVGAVQNPGSSPVSYRPFPKGYTPPTTVAVFQIRLPIGIFSDNKKVWKLLHNGTNSPATIALLRANGMRAGQAAIPVWHKIYKLINVSGGTTSTTLCQTTGLSKVQIAVRRNIRRELLLYHDATGRAILRSYRDCDNVFILAMHINPNTRSTVVQLEPAVNLGTVSFHRGRHSLGLVGGSHPQLHAFARLQVIADIPPGDFLVVSPIHTLRQPFSIGPEFLSQSARIPPRETILVMVPVRER